VIRLIRGVKKKTGVIPGLLKGGRDKGKLSGIEFSTFFHIVEDTFSGLVDAKFFTLLVDVSNH
jgi:hypothetical protein